MPETSLDAFLGGRVRLRQLRAGHRAGLDAALLAAAAGDSVGRFADVGASVGAVALSLLTRWPQAQADLVEIDAEAAALASENLETNGVADRARVVLADVLAPPSRRAAGLADEAADLVVSNPPFYATGTVRVSPVTAKAGAHVFPAQEGDPLGAWVRACLALLKPHGRFLMIHRADALGALLQGIGARLGDVALRPVHPRSDSEAIRILVSGVKGSKAPLRLLPGLTLHEDGGAYTAQTEAVLRGEATL